MADLKYAVKILKKLKVESTEMFFGDLGPIYEWRLEGHADAGHKSLPDQISSCGGFVILISNPKQKVKSVVTWRSKKLKRTASSSTDAEGQATNEVVDHTAYVKNLILELLGDEVRQIPVHIFTDSENFYQSVTGTNWVENPRVRSEVTKVRESMDRKETDEFHLVPGKQMIADCLTKKGAPADRLMKMLRKGL